MDAKEAAIQAAQGVCGVKTAGGLGGMIGNLGQHWKAPAPLATPTPPPKPVPAPQPLQQPSTAGKMVGYKPTTTLGAQVGRWYENAGGLNKAINGAQQAQQNRAPGVLNPNTWPTWKPSDVTQRQVPISESAPMDAEAEGYGGFYDANKGNMWLNSTYLGFNPNHRQSILEHELSHAAYMRDTETGIRQDAAAGIASDGVTERDPNWNVSQLAETKPTTTPGVRARITNPEKVQENTYTLAPAEADVRLAEIKRRYAHATGQIVNTPEEAEKAWEWWREHGNFRGAEENTPTLERREFNVYDELPDAQKQQLFHRMPELVQRNPNAYAFGAKQASTNSVANLAARNSERQSDSTLFHGSTKNDLDELKVNQPNMGAAGIYGADNLDWAALYALAKDRRGMAVLGGAKPKLLINKANKLAPEGYVYEYAADNATPPPASDPNLGWHVPGNITPLRKHLVKLVDHLKNIEQFDDKEALRKRWEELNSKKADLLPDVHLQEHQQRIADKIVQDNPRLLVYHGLGSGKSLSALAAAEAAKKKYHEDYGIVVPASLRGNFQKEVKKFTKGSDPEIMSYTGLALGKQFHEPPETVIMDEAHRLRNPEAASSQAARRVAEQAKRVMLLTGSPITNSPSDLAGLLSMLTDKTITPEEFQKRYVGYQNVSPGWINWLRGIKPGEKPYVKNEKELRQMLQGKVDYQPSKTPEGVNVNEEVIRVPLSAEQQKIQKAIRTKIPPGFLWKLDREFPLSRDELARLNSFLTGLRQVSLSTQPFRVDKDPAKAFTQSAKLQTAMKNLQQVLDSDPRKKAIIYSNFIDSGLKPYSAALEKAQIPHGIFHGSIPVKQRLQALKDYNEGKLRALLLGPAAAEGISTKGTSLIQLLDPHWHESRSQQAKGRGLRFDSHADLPEELKNVAIQRYISSSQDPSLLGKWLGYQRERTGDEVLEHLTADKERLNEEFRKILRDVGTKK